MNLPLVARVVAERTGEDLISPEGETVFTAHPLHPHHDRIEIGRGTVIVVAAERGVDTDDVAGLESVDESDLELGLILTIRIKPRIVAILFTAFPVLGWKVPVDVDTPAVGPLLGSGQETVRIDKRGDNDRFVGILLMVIPEKLGKPEKKVNCGILIAMDRAEEKNDLP